MAGFLRLCKFGRSGNEGGNESGSVLVEALLWAQLNLRLIVSADSNDFMLWGVALPGNCLSSFEIDYLASLPDSIPSVEWVWQEMDRVWKGFRLDNRVSLSGQDIDRFYSHPVWLMNGVFTEVDSISAGHRAAIADCLHSFDSKQIADYGGGFGALAREITETIPDSVVTIIEPYPSPVGLERLKAFHRIKFSSSLDANRYDAVTLQDVLEHIEDPVGMAYAAACALREDGIVIFANSFFPVIQCHLPSTFHLRHTFRRVVEAMGLEFVGYVSGAEHAQIFRRQGSVSLDPGRRVERISRFVGPALNVAYGTMVRIRNLVIGK